MSTTSIGDRLLCTAWAGMRNRRDGTRTIIATPMPAPFIGWLVGTLVRCEGQYNPGHRGGVSIFGEDDSEQSSLTISRRVRVYRVAQSFRGPLREVLPEHVIRRRGTRAPVKVAPWERWQEGCIALTNGRPAYAMPPPGWTECEGGWVNDKMETCDEWVPGAVEHAAFCSRHTAPPRTARV